MIDELGLRNTDVDAQHAKYNIAPEPYHQGTPYPGYFVLDQEGVVVSKKIEESYRIRPSSTVMRRTLIGADFGNEQSRTETDSGLQLVVLTDESVVRPYELHLIDILIQTPPGMHIYVPPVPEGYQALEVWITGEPDLEIREPSLPIGQPHTLKGIDEEFQVATNEIAISTPFLVRGEPQKIDVSVEVRFQMCDDSVCLPPSSLSSEFVLPVLPLIRD